MQQRTENNLRCLLLTAASALVWTSSAHAAGTPSRQPPVLEEVVVTAERRSEVLENVPIAITAATGAALEKRGLTRLEDINQLAPAVSLARIGIFLQPVIRGVTTNVATFGENNVAIYLDGFYIPSSRGLNVELANLKQVEILKGPQGTLFGRNATGGAFLLQTLDPSLTERSGHAQATIGNYSDKRAQLYFSTPITDTLAFNFAGSVHSSHSYLKDIGGFDPAPIRLYSLKAKLLFEPTDRLSLLASYMNSRVSDGRANSSTNVGRSLSLFQFPNVPIATASNTTSYNHPQISDVYQNMATLKATYDFGWAKIASYTSRLLERSALIQEAGDMSPVQFNESYSHERWNTFTQEVNLTSSAPGKLQYVLGAYYFDNKQRSPYDSFTRGLGATTFTRSQTADINTKAYAFYADATYQAAEPLFLTLGVRYSHEKKDQLLFNATNNFAGLGPFIQKWNSFTPRAVIRYNIAERTNVYASVSQGFKSGFINTTSPFSPVAPEKITAYEVGYKTAAGGIRFDAAAYYYDYKDLQVTTVLVINNVFASLTNNAATAKIYGVDAQISATPMENLNVTAALGYTHARYGTYVNAVVNIPSATTGLNSSTCANPSPPPATTICVQDWSGRRIQRSPDWTATLSADYTIPVSFGELVLSGNASYQSFFLPSRTDRGLNGSGYRYGQPATAQLNLQGAWVAPGNRWRLTGYVNNVTNTRVKYSYSGSSFGDSKIYAWPRTYGAKIDVNF